MKKIYILMKQYPDGTEDVIKVFDSFLSASNEMEAEIERYRREYIKYILFCLDPDITENEFVPNLIIRDFNLYK